MIKKVILSVFVLAASVYSTALASSSNSTDDFNPEHSEFSRLTTLKTWVASRHLAAPSETKSLQRNIAMTVPENRFSINFVRQVANNLEDKRFFGKTFFTIKDGELPFLQFVHEISKVKAPVVLEIAAARGYVTWKIPYCFETTGTVYANDLSWTPRTTLI